MNTVSIDEKNELIGSFPLEVRKQLDYVQQLWNTFCNEIPDEYFLIKEFSVM